VDLGSTATRGISRVFVSGLEAAGDARRALGDMALPPTTRAKLTLLVSELVTNCVRHVALPPANLVTLSVTEMPGRVHITVHDVGPGFDRTELATRAPLEVGGEGLVIVAALADDWGVHLDKAGCTVWCEVLVDQEPPATIELEVETGYVNELAAQLATPPA
jgi:anti-sigma regulatory factor (Ser/Thr protein kinase)